MPRRGISEYAPGTEGKLKIILRVGKSGMGREKYYEARGDGEVPRAATVAVLSKRID